MSFNDLDKQEEIKMSPEEEKKHKSFFSRICFSLVVYIVLTQCLGVLADYILNSINPELAESQNVWLIISTAIQYLIGFPALYLILKPMPKSAPVKAKLTGKEFFKVASISVFLMYVGNYVSLILMEAIESRFGALPENGIATILTDTDYIISIFLVGIIGPIVEEIIFRKLLIDRIRPYGEKIAVFFPALIFGLVHGSLYQFFYAFLIGTVLSYIYVKTGKIIYSTIIHCLINLVFGVLTSYISSLIDLEQLLEFALVGSIPEEYIAENLIPLSLYGIYTVIFYVFFFAGLVNFNRQIYRIRFKKGEVLFPKGKTLEVLTFNAGAIILISICIAMMALNTFSFALT